jgi:autotransporter-associated beta strand protein
VGNLVIGTDLTIVSQPSEVSVRGTTNNKDITFYANIGGNTTTKSIAISGSTGSVSFDKSVSVTENLSTAGTLSVTGASTLTGAVSVQNGLLPTSDNTIDIGTSSQKFNEIFASSFVGNLINGNVTATTATISGNLTVLGNIFINTNVVATQSYVTSTIATAGKNSQGNKYVSASPPSGGSNGDIWYQI